MWANGTCAAYHLSGVRHEVCQALDSRIKWCDQGEWWEWSSVHDRNGLSALEDLLTPFPMYSLHKARARYVNIYLKMIHEREQTQMLYTDLFKDIYAQLDLYVPITAQTRTHLRARNQEASLHLNASAQVLQRRARACLVEELSLFTNDSDDARYSYDLTIRSPEQELVGAIGFSLDYFLKEKQSRARARMLRFARVLAANGPLPALSAISLDSAIGRLRDAQSLLRTMKELHGHSGCLWSTVAMVCKDVYTYAENPNEPDVVAQLRARSSAWPRMPVPLDPDYPY